MKRSLSLALALLLLACGEPDAQADPGAASAPAEAKAAAAPERVEVERVGLASLRATLAASGTIEARRITEIGSEVPGRIVAVFVNVGDSVEADAKLFQIDPGPYRMALAEAEAGLRLARANSANAAEEAERLRTLLERNAASQQRYDQLRTQAEVARAQVAQMEARVEKAQRDLAQTEVRAPYAASVVERRAHEGAMAGQGAILVVQERGALEAILNVPEATPVAVRPGDTVRLFVEGLPDPLEASVGSVSQRVDPGSRTYEVRVPVTDTSGQLKAGSYARAELAVSRAEPRPVAHRSSVLARDGRTYVLVVEDGVVRYAPVRVGVSEGEQVELLGGVDAGALVVRGEATGRLAEGTRVTPSESAAQAANDLPSPPP
jgi:RND family efflux transporter MFP subunit